jgi:hypothetical protein
MPQTFLSPGVETVEVDQSFLQAGAPQPGAILIGTHDEGTGLRPGHGPDFTEFSSVFGGTSIRSTSSPVRREELPEELDR